MIIITKKVIAVATMKTDIAVEATAEADVAQNSRNLLDVMLEKSAALITKELLMMEHSLILLTTEVNRLNLLVEQE